MVIVETESKKRISVGPFLLCHDQIPMMWCCSAFEECIYKDGKPIRFAVMRGYKEPPRPGLR